MFPIEWVLTENIRHLSTIDLDTESLIRIRDTYSLILTEELKSRKVMENKLKAFYGDEKIA